MSESEQFETYAGGALQVHVQGQHIEVLEEKVARLREALALCRDVIGEAHSYHAKTNVNFGLYLRLSGCDMALDEFDLGTVLAHHDKEVRAQERERCAKIADEYAKPTPCGAWMRISTVAKKIAATIREADDAD